VPAHYLVDSPVLAQKAASALGYPVVVKAADLDGGVGVFAGLRTPMAVQRAYAEVIKLSKQVLVEQFIQGQDYRLQVFQGEVFWVALRRPACVCGDGQASVVELVRRENARRAQSVVDPNADVMREWGGKPISLDEEATEWLAAQGLTLSSVPPVGRVVRLRGAANVTQGGTREGVALDVVHPDNLALAVRAVAALRLDLAGVDLLVPDIRRSWKKTGGAICEVNAQPQLSGHLQNLLLGQLLQGQGRVPVLCLCLPPGAWDERAAVKRALAHFGLRLAWVDGANACLQALRDPSVDVLIWSLKEPVAPLASMPVDVLDTLVVEHRHGASNEAHMLQGESVSWMGLRAKQIWRVGEPTQGACLSWAGLADALVQYLTTSSAAPLVR
jgi:cyanophycin synthetase